MRILTVRQPWAWAIIHGQKDVENRSWLTTYRGPVAIHAGQAIDPDGFYAEPMITAGARSARMRFGVILGVVDLVEAHHHEAGCCSSPWAQPGEVHLRIGNPRPLAQPVPMRGALGLRGLADDVEQLVHARLAAVSS